MGQGGRTRAGKLPVAPEWMNTGGHGLRRLLEVLMMGEQMVLGDRGRVLRPSESSPAMVRLLDFLGKGGRREIPVLPALYGVDAAAAWWAAESSADVFRAGREHGGV